MALHSFRFLLTLAHVAAVLPICYCLGRAVCPCKDPSLCEPIKGSPKNEVFGFVTSQSSWPSYNWSLLTTVALFTEEVNTSLLCHAHEQGVRVVLSASYPTSELHDSTKVKVWIEDQLNAVQTQFADGLNIDIEGAIQNGTNQSALLVWLVEDTYKAFKAANSDYQVTFDVAWSPNCIDERCYDYISIATSTDFIVIMAYDERSQIHGDCIASANSALPITASGVQAYLDLGVPPEYLVLGLPWYGYDYPCLSLSNDSICTIPKIPFRGAACSDAAGVEKAYDTIRDLIRTSTSFVQWSPSLQSPFFNYKSLGGDYHQVWFDNTESLSLKYAYAARRGLRGLAIWNIDSVSYGRSPHDRLLTTEMWEAILIFFAV